MRRTIVLGVLCAALGPAVAATPAEMLAGYEAAARRDAADFAGSSAERGERLFNAKPSGDWSCATCHGAIPNTAGKHVRTAKVIAPLAPAANPQRFTDPGKVQKWFRRNCRDVLTRECSAAEKADLLAFLLKVERALP